MRNFLPHTVLAIGLSTFPSSIEKSTPPSSATEAVRRNNNHIASILQRKTPQTLIKTEHTPLKWISPDMATSSIKVQDTISETKSSVWVTEMDITNDLIVTWTTIQEEQDLNYECTDSENFEQEMAKFLEKLAIAGPEIKRMFYFKAKTAPEELFRVDLSWLNCKYIFGINNWSIDSLKQILQAIKINPEIENEFDGKTHKFMASIQTWEDTIKVPLGVKMPTIDQFYRWDFAFQEITHIYLYLTHKHTYLEPIGEGK